MSSVPPELLAQLMGGGSAPPGAMPGMPPMPPQMDPSQQAMPPPAMPPPGMEPPLFQPPPIQPPDWDAIDIDTMVVPVRLDQQEEDRLCEFLHDEIERSGRFLQHVHKEIRELREQYAEYRRPKNFPWEKCSNYSVPMSQPAVNNVAGRNIRVLTATSPLVLVEALPGVEDQFADPDLLQGIQDFLNSKLMTEPRFYQATVEWILETSILGTGIVKSFWEREERHTRSYVVDVDPMTGRSTPRIVDADVCDFEGTRIELIRTEDAFFPPEAWNDSQFIKNAQWFAQRYRIRWPLLEALCKDGKDGWRKESLEKLRGEADQTDYSEQSTFIDPKSRKMSDVQDPGHESANELVLYNLFLRWPTGPNGEEEDLSIIYSFRHEALLRVIRNPYFHGRRPFHRMLYWPIPNSAFGRGICELLRNPQLMANDLWNSANDALTLANTGVWVSGKEVGVKPGKNDRIWPGRWITLDQPDSMHRLDMGNPSPMSTEFMSQVDQMAQRASGVGNSAMTGEGVTGNRETAQSVMQRSGAMTPIFDVVLDQIRHPIAELAEIMLVNFQQFAPKGQTFLSSSASGKAMEKFLQLPIESIAGKLKYSVVASTASANNETKKLTLVDLMQTLKPILANMGELVSAMSGPQMPPATVEVAKHDLQTSLAIARQICQTYEVPGADHLLPTWQEFWGSVSPLIDQAKQQAASQPPPMDPSVQRHVFPAFQQLSAMEAIQVLKTAGIMPGNARQELADAEAQSVPLAGGPGPMGQPGPEGSGPMPGAPGEMPGLPMPPGGPPGEQPGGPGFIGAA